MFLEWLTRGLKNKASFCLVICYLSTQEGFPQFYFVEVLLMKNINITKCLEAACHTKN